MARALVLILVLALSTLLAVPLVWAQAGSGMGGLVPPLAPGFTQGNANSEQTPTGCTTVPMVTPSLPIRLLDKDAVAILIVATDKDGMVRDAVIDTGSGDAGRDAALLAYMKANWRFRPLRQGCVVARSKVTVHYLHITCAPKVLPETQTTPDVKLQDRPRVVELQVGVLPDGSVVQASVTRSSGDAALDAAAMAHVRQAWRWEPYSCPTATPPVMGAATIRFPYMTAEP